jgi:hypothetical protein
MRLGLRLGRWLRLRLRWLSGRLGLRLRLGITMRILRAVSLLIPLTVPLLPLLLIVVVPLLLLLLWLSARALGLLLIPPCPWTPWWRRWRHGLLLLGLRRIWSRTTRAALLLAAGITRRSAAVRSCASCSSILWPLLRLRLVRLLVLVPAHIVARSRRVLRVLAVRRRLVVVWRRGRLVLVPRRGLLLGMRGRRIVWLLRLRLGLRLWLRLWLRLGLWIMPPALRVGGIMRMVLVSRALLFSEFAIVASTFRTLGRS